MMSRLDKKPEVKRYLLRIAFAMTLYLGSLWAAEVLIEDGGMQGWAAYALAATRGCAIVSAYYTGIARRRRDGQVVVIELSGVPSESIVQPLPS